MAAPKKKPKNSSLSADDSFISTSAAEKINIDQLISQALARHKFKEEDVDKKAKLKEITHLSKIAEEYLSCYALIGYSMQNEKVVILSTPSSKDEAAMVDLLRATYLDIASNRP